ncbi:MAG: glycosyltransferase family 2 protein [Candidatus Krumholzibacteriia bacterium]
MSLDLSIVIVHYNTPDDLGRCLQSLRDQAPACDHEVVVVDNASSAPGLDELQAAFDQVRWVRNPENLGYGRACNQGMALVPARYHLILNPDIVVLPGALDALLAFADTQPRAGIIGPQLLNEDGSIQESCRRFYTFWTLLLRRTILGKLLPNSRTVARHLMRDFDHRSVRPVDWVLGGCLLVRREALDRCGPMDDRFFLYFEDVDWCYRMWRCGYEVVYLPDARFVHRHRRASARGAFTRSFWLHLTSLIAFYEKWSLVVYVAKKWRRPMEVVLHWLLDMALLAAALLGAYGARRLAQPLFDTELLPLAWYAGWFGWSALMVTVAFALMGRYGRAALQRGFTWGAHLRQIAMVALLLLAGSYLGREEAVSRAVLLACLGLYTGLAAWASQLVGRLHGRLTRGYLALERTLLVGTVTDIQDWFAAGARPQDLGIDVVGYVTAGPADGAHHPALGRGDVPWLGTTAALVDLVERFRVSQVALWTRPGEADGLWDSLVRLRRQRIRLRWILAEAWLLAVGARADRFGAQASGVLDPDDGQALRRWSQRPLEVLVGLPLALAALLLVPLRRWRLAQGRLRRVALTGEPLAGVTVVTDRQGAPRPLWWQDSLVRALLRGRLGLTGVPLRRAERSGADADRLLDLEAERPGLTGPWAVEGGRRAALAPLWRTFFMNPGGWGEGGAAEAAPHPAVREEVQRR